MKRNLIFVAVVGISTAIMFIAGCPGSKSNGNQALVPPPTGPGGICYTGQTCYNPAGPAQGLPLLNGPSISSLDYSGSSLILNFGAPNVVAGQPYSGPVNISGTIQLAPGACMGLPPGAFPIQGQGIWVSNYGGAIGGVEATLQTPSGMVRIYGATVKFGSNPLNPMPQPQGYYLQGQVEVSSCGRVFTAL